MAVYLTIDIDGSDGGVTSDQAIHELAFAVLVLPELDFSVASAGSKVAATFVELHRVHFAFVAIELIDGFIHQWHVE